MRRREFIALLRGAAIVYPLNAFARQNPPFVQIRPVVVTPEVFRIAYPKVQAWIQKTLAAYEKAAQPIASMHFARLPLYFDYDLLETVKFIFEISDPRWVHAIQGWNWLGCVRFVDRGHRRSYALLFNGSTVVDGLMPIRQTIVALKLMSFSNQWEVSACRRCTKALH